LINPHFGSPQLAADVAWCSRDACKHLNQFPTAFHLRFLPHIPAAFSIVSLVLLAAAAAAAAAKGQM
jgi:hypothetical protein